jgi:hypothetical protein
LVDESVVVVGGADCNVFVLIPVEVAEARDPPTESVEIV